MLKRKHKIDDTEKSDGPIALFVLEWSFVPIRIDLANEFGIIVSKQASEDFFFILDGQQMDR